VALESSAPTLDNLLAATVERFWYAEQAGLPDSVTQGEAVTHFLESGLEQNFSPSPLFPATAEAPDMRTRLLAAMAEGPTEGWFDVGVYLAQRPDAVNSGIPPFAHFLCAGLADGAEFSHIFDHRWYADVYHQELANRKLPAFLHYLSTASTGLVAPCLALLPIFAHRTETSQIEINRFSLVSRAARRWLSRLGPDRFAMLAGLFYSPRYDGGGDLDPNADGPERFAHFLDKGLELGLDPGPLFEVAMYQPEALPAITRGTALLHFLEKGEAQPAPSTLFNEAEYLKRNLDLPQNNFWLLRHFVRDGLFEGRNIDNTPRTPVHLVSEGPAARALMNWRGFWAVHDPDAAKDPAIALLIRTTRRIQTMLSSPMFRQSLNAARDLDPAIGDPTGHTIVIPPMNDPREPARVEILRRLPRLHYDAIICMPWIRNGGADLVGCLLAETIASDPLRTVLLLRVDQPHCDRPDWLPARVDVVHISDIVQMLTPSQAEDFLYSLLIGLAPANVFNVNSNLCWRTLSRYGGRLVRHMELYAYLFCWDHDEKGLRVGYPSDFFTTTAPNMTAIFTDTLFLRDELVKIYQPPSVIERKLIPLFSPIRSIPERLSVAAEVSANRVRVRPRVLWAGRLDPQKRFDLVIEVAKLLPEIDFECWGGAVLGKSNDWELPANIQLHGFFTGYEQLGLEDADAWLFTSDWEGMPTLIIELAIRGTPLVASAVGGVPELITPATGYPVASFSGPDAYVAALRDALANPQERIARARALQALALSRHTRDSYSTAIEAAIRKGR
jgi:glycosyltransferase involved in cell wall biosynthesis